VALKALLPVGDRRGRSMREGDEFLCKFLCNSLTPPTPAPPGSGLLLQETERPCSERLADELALAPGPSARYTPAFLRHDPSIGEDPGHTRRPWRLAG